MMTTSLEGLLSLTAPAARLVLLLFFLARTGTAQFPPASTNCSATAAAGWEVSNFTFDTDTRVSYGPGTAGTVSFSIRNVANGYQFDCLQGEAQRKRLANHVVVDGKLWYSCNVYCYGTTRDPWEYNPPLNTSFHFDVDTKQLSVTQDWACAGKNGLGSRLLLTSALRGTELRRHADRPDIGP